MVEYFFGGTRADPVVRWLDAHEGAVHSAALAATYVALAEALDCSLVTYDTALRDAPGVRADVQVLGA